MKFGFEGLDARLHALQFFNQLFVLWFANRLSLRVVLSTVLLPAVAKKEATVSAEVNPRCRFRARALK